MAYQEPMIELIGLGKTFESKNSHVKALEDINLTIYEGEIFGIIGLSGAGKSTLVRCINYLERPTTGKVIFDKIDLSEVDDMNCWVRQSKGMIFQQTTYHFSIKISLLQNVNQRAKSANSLILGLSDRGPIQRSYQEDKSRG